jgi:hypothetical protein
MTDEAENQEMKLSDLTVQKAAAAYIEFFGKFGGIPGVLVGMLVYIVGAFAVIYGAGFLLVELVIWLGRWIGRYALLIPMAIVVALMLAIVWPKRNGAFDKKKDSK